MLLFYPDLVDMDAIDGELYTGLPAELPNYDVLPIIADYTPPSGCLSHPGASSREKGVILRDVAVKNMVEAIKKIRLSGFKPPRRRPARREGGRLSFSKGVVADAACRLVLRIERDGPFLGRLPRDSMKGHCYECRSRRGKSAF